MRQIATLPDEPLAQRFADFLLTLQIHTQLIPEGEQFGVWVRDEDRLPRARQELETFLKAPDDARYGQASATARAIRQGEAATEKEYQRRQRHFSELMGNIGVDRPVVTISLLIVSVLVTLATNFVQPISSPLAQAMFIQSVRMADDDMYFVPEGLTDVRSGQVWRLVTPIFLHFNLLHLAFNMLMLYQFGGAVEASRGRLKFILLVLVLAVVSNVAQFYCHVALDRQPWIDFKLMPIFGGMSGVLYGLFGYAWMKSRYEPELGLVMAPRNVFIMLGWFAICLAGAIGSVANTAHGAGMLAGMAIALAPLAWRRP